MTNQTFNLSGEYITLDKLLKLMRLVGSGGEAHAVISERLVEVNGETETQKRKKLRVGDTVSFDGQVIELVA